MEPTPKHKTRTLWLCGILHAFTHVYQVVLMPLYLLIQEDLKLPSVSATPLLVTVMGLAYFLPSYLTGVLADRTSRKRMLTFGLMINGLGFIALSFAPSYAWALAAVVVAGLGGSLFHPAATPLVARLYPVETGKALGLVAIGASAGFFAGPIFAGWRAVATGSWRTPVLELGLLGVLTAVLFAWLAEEDRPAAPASPRVKSSQKLFPSTALWCYFLALSVAFSLRDFAGSGMGSLSSLFLQKARHFTPGMTGLALSGIFLASAISNPLFGRLSDTGRIRWASAVLATAALMMAVFPWMPSAWLIPVALAYGFFFMASYPITEAAVVQAVPDAVRGRVYGLFITVGGLFGNFGHWSVGHWVRQLGSEAENPASYHRLYGLLAVLVLLSLSGLPCLHAIRRREDECLATAAAAKRIGAD